VGDELPAPIEGQALIYATADGAVRVEVLFQDETFWLSQRGMAELFGVDVRTVSEHLQTIFRTGELIEESVVRKFRITAADGKRYLTNLYNLDAVISVGYRVNSRQATQFRIWATQTLKEFIVKGFVLDDERLKQGARFGQDYFDELLGRIREIRASEKRFYQKVRDLYATAIDYDPHSDAAQLFFKKAQNKMLWAVTGKTAAEIVVERAESTQPNMGSIRRRQAAAGGLDDGGSEAAAQEGRLSRCRAGHPAHRVRPGVKDKRARGRRRADGQRSLSTACSSTLRCVGAPAPACTPRLSAGSHASSSVSSKRTASSVAPRRARSHGTWTKRQPASTRSRISAARAGVRMQSLAPASKPASMSAWRPAASSTMYGGPSR